MIKSLRKYNILLLFLLCGFFSCRKMDELNINPNSPTTVNPDYLFTQSLVKGMGSYTANVNLNYWVVSHWVMNFATLKGDPAGREYESNSGKDLWWKETYSQALINAREVIRLTQDNPNLVNKTAMARIWEVFLFHQLSDLWGAVPHSEALKGMEALNYYPAYDKQSMIYSSLIAQLKDAAAQLDDTKPVFNGAADPIYSGSVSNWKAFANSLRLRLALRLRFVNPALCQQTLQDLQSTSLISNNSQTAAFHYNSTFRNPLYELIVIRKEAGSKVYPSKFLIDKLMSTNDPRLKLIAAPTLESQVFGFDDYAGVPNLVPSENTTVWQNYHANGDNISNIGSWYLREDAPGVLVSYAEVCFIKAEATLAGYWTGTAQQYYADGVQAALQSYGSLTATEVSTYMNTLPAVTQENIITQKWLSYTYQNIFETYSEYRRTGYPALKNYDGTPIDQSVFPNRLTYPFTEQSLNTSHCTEAQQLNGGADVPGLKVWWDLN